MHLKTPHFWELRLLRCLLFSHSIVSPWTEAHQGSLSFTISWSLLKLMYWVSDAIQPSHHLSPTSPVSVRFQWVSLLHQVTKALELQLQHQPFQWILMVDFLWDWLVWSPCSPRDSQQSSPTPQFGYHIRNLAKGFFFFLLSYRRKNSGQACKPHCPLCSCGIFPFFLGWAGKLEGKSTLSFTHSLTHSLIQHTLLRLI